MVELAKGQLLLLEDLSQYKNGMGLDGMTALVKVDWPMLRMLDVSRYDQELMMTPSQYWCLETGQPWSASRCQTRQTKSCFVLIMLKQFTAAM